MRRLALVVLAACGNGGVTADAPPLADAGPNDHRPDRVGLVQLFEGGFASTFAMIQDGPELPTAMVTSRDGECAIYKRPQLGHCDPACSNGACIANSCTPWPSNAGAGPITVTGLRAPLVFRAGMFGYTPDPAPGDDLFDRGAEIRVSAPGDTTPAFAATVTGVAPLQAEFQNLTLVDGRDQAVRWTAAGDARIQVALVVGWHGAPYEAMLLCETDDDGELVIPGAVISKLPRASSGLEPHPSWILRFSRAVVTVPAGPIEIVAGSQVNLYFTHP